MEATGRGVFNKDHVGLRLVLGIQPETEDASAPLQIANPNVVVIHNVIAVVKQIIKPLLGQEIFDVFVEKIDDAAVLKRDRADSLRDGFGISQVEVGPLRTVFKSEIQNTRVFVPTIRITSV